MRLILQEADRLRDDGQPNAAASAYRAAAALAPSRADILVQCGNMLKDSGALAEALSMYRQAIGLSNTADTHLQLGHVLKALGDRAGAQAAYRQALALDPETPGAVQELAEAGDRLEQARRFDVQLRGGGTEALVTLSAAIAGMRSELDRLSRALPEALACTAFPVALWDSFRELFPVPPPPDGPRPGFHIVLLAERESVAGLFAQLGAISQQAHSDWTLAVLGDSDERRRVVELAGVADQRIAWVPTPALAEDETAHFDKVGAPWVLLLAEGAMLDPRALAWFAAAAAWSEACAFICDEEQAVRTQGRIRRGTPTLRQVVDHATLLEDNVFGETIAVRRDILQALAAGIDTASPAAARRSLLLMLDRRVGHVPYPLVWRAEVYRSEPPARWVAPPAVDVGIAVVVPSRDNAADLRRMIQSLQATADRPELLEILVVDNTSGMPADLSGLACVRAWPIDAPFNWAFFNNEAVRETGSPLLVFANDDMRMVSTGWDTTLRRLLADPGVGAVGARLLYDDDTIQHAGVLFGWRGSVIHDGLFEPADAPGPARRWQVTRQVGAVTGAFLATTRDHFTAMGGFDARYLPVAYSDIDFCLKLRRAGMRVLYAPDVTLYHHESKTRSQDHADRWRAARNAQERAVMEERWGEAMTTDPGLHPMWVQATLPFRLLAAPSLERVRAHVRRTGFEDAWKI